MKVTVSQAADLLLGGSIVAMPTDTVYGLAASLQSLSAVEKLFLLKKRPKSNPLVIQIAKVDVLDFFLDTIPDGFFPLAERFWPGGLTLVMPIRLSSVPELVRSGLSSAAFRIPNHSIALELLKKSGPLAVPSANRYGNPPATCAKHVENDFGMDFPVIDGGDAKKGLESTILSYSGHKWVLERMGTIVSEDFSDILGYIPQSSSKNKTEGSKGKSIKLRLHLRHREYDGSISHVLGFDGRSYPSAKVTFLGSLSNPDSISLNLYPALRSLEANQVGDVWVDMNFSMQGILLAVASKLKKLAHSFE